MADEGRTQLEHAQAIFVRMIEADYGCPIEDITHAERNEWANAKTTCKRELDVIRDGFPPVRGRT